MNRVTHLRGLQAVELATRVGSLKAAAEELAITPAALGQRIRALEDYLGFELLIRGRSGVRPTPQLEPAVAHLRAAFRELDTSAALLDFQRVDEIHIAADSDWAALWLGPRLAQLKATVPNLRFCINGVGDVPARVGDVDADVSVVPAGSRDDSEVLYRDYLAPVASPINRRRVGALTPTEMLEGFPLLHLDCYTSETDDLGWTEWVRRFGHRRTAPERGIRYRRLLHAIEAVTANAGFVICGLSLILPQLDAGSLVLPFPIREGRWSNNVYRIRFGQRAIERRSIQQFRRWLLDNAAATANILAERVGSDPPVEVTRPA